MGIECHRRYKRQGKVTYSAYDLEIICGDRVAIFGIANWVRGKTRHTEFLHGYVQASPQIIDKVAELIETARTRALEQA